MTRNAPGLWDAGWEWGPASTPGADFYWQADEEPSQFSGRAVLCIAIAGRRVDGEGVESDDAGFTSASWALGRSDWLSTLAPNTASFQFRGIVDAAPNDIVVLSVEVDDSVKETHPPALWIGRVDTSGNTQDAAGHYVSTVAATDKVGALGGARAPEDLGTGVIGTLQTLGESLALAAGIPLVIDTDDTLADIFGDPDPIDASLLEFINRMERTSNALLFLLGDGTFRAVVRQGIAAGSIEIIPLTGLDGFTNWTEQTSLANVLNKWKFGGITGWTASGGDFDVTDSIAAYGERKMEILDMLSPTESPYTGSGIITVLAEPRAVVTDADAPIYDMSQNIMWLDPLDWVDHAGDHWQVMSVKHDASPGSWRISITADQTQNFLVGDPDPTPDDPEPPVGSTTISHTYTSTKSAVVFLDTDSSSAGNGAGDYLPVGYYAGTVTRGLIQFPIDWSDFPGFIRVQSAVMTLRTTGQVWVAFGDHPKFYVKGLTESWSEGTFTGSPPHQYGVANAVNWANQPKATAAGQRYKSIGDSEDTDRDVTITEIAQGWHDSGNYGLRLMSANESSSGNTIEFFSDDYATSGFRPSLRLVCEVEV